MAKKGKPKAGRYIHIEFPPEGIDDVLDRLFTYQVLNANNLVLFTKFQVEVSYTGMFKSMQPEELSVVRGLRLVK